MFLHDKKPPSAIIIQHIPNMKTLAFSTYTKAGAAQLRATLAEIHRAGITHDDTHPRNMMMISKGPVPAMWIDFDVSITWSENGVMTATGVPDPERYKISLEYDDGMTDQVLTEMVRLPLEAARTIADRCQVRYFKDGTPMEPLIGMKEDPLDYPDFGSDFEDASDAEAVPDLVKSTGASSSPKSNASPPVDEPQLVQAADLPDDVVRVRESDDALDEDYDQELEHRPKKRRLDRNLMDFIEANTL